MRLEQTLGAGKILKRIPANFIRDGVVNTRAMFEELIANGSLREDDTKQIDETITKVARRDLRAVARLRTNGLVANLRDIGVTSFEFDRISPVGPASQAMSILGALGFKDLVDFGRSSIPVPVTAAGFDLDARQRAAGSNRGQPISMTNVEEHTRAVLETLEDNLVNGSPVKLGGNGMPGYTNFGSRHQLSFSDAAWNALSGGLEAAVTDTLAMRSALRDDGFTGPYDLYIPQDFDGVLDEDYKANDSRTLRERLKAIDGVSFIDVLPSLPNSEVLLVQQTSSVVEAAVGQDVTPISFDTHGGLSTEWIIMAVMGFALKAAIARAALSQGTLPALTTSSGIAHLS